jgi:ABC-type glycerol-3-phosphate transport system substrate-binding protein
VRENSEDGNYYSIPIKKAVDKFRSNGYLFFYIKEFLSEVPIRVFWNFK